MLVSLAIHHTIIISEANDSSGNKDMYEKRDWQMLPER